MKPWILQNEATLREFLYERENQWERTMRQVPKKWTANVWADVYGFAPRNEEGWASRKDTYFAGKFRMEHVPKDGFHPGDCKNPRERRMIDFLLPILYPEKPKRLSITMANTIFGALSGTQGRSTGRDSSMNWWRSRSPTSARNPIIFPLTFFIPISKMGVSKKRNIMP